MVNIIDPDQIVPCAICGVLLDRHQGEDFYVEHWDLVLCVCERCWVLEKEDE